VNSKVIGGVIYSSPVINGDTILVAPTGFDALLVALNLDGNQKWTFTPAK
jgi:outer membrane protein assembly factor BamB